MSYLVHPPANLTLKFLIWFHRDITGHIFASSWKLMQAFCSAALKKRALWTPYFLALGIIKDVLSRGQTLIQKIPQVTLDPATKLDSSVAAARKTTMALGYVQGCRTRQPFHTGNGDLKGSPVPGPARTRCQQREARNPLQKAGGAEVPRG